MIYEPNYEIELKSNLNKIIKVIGVGGAGCNAIRTMHNQGMKGVDFIVCNTDEQSLQLFPEDVNRLQIGADLTKGLGAGTNWEVGRDAALESEEAIKAVLADPTEMVFVTAGMGGGTGTGAAPEIARLAKELGRLTIGVVTYPFRHEGRSKLSQADLGIEKLKEHCDTVLVIKNDRLAAMYADMAIEEAYEKADNVLAGAVRSIAELITRPGIINLDFADVKTVLGNAGHAMMGTAEASGPERAFEAIENALTSPLLENSNIKGAKRVLVSIAYSDEKPEYKIKMSDQTSIMDYVETQIKFQAEIFKHGYAVDKNLGDKIRVTIVAAQIDANVPKAPDKKNIPEKAAPQPGIPEPAAIGGGIDAVIPPKTPKTQKPVPGQTNLFESQEMLKKQFAEFSKGNIDYKALKTIPAYKRFNAIMYDDYEISAINPDNVVRYEDIISGNW